MEGKKKERIATSDGLMTELVRLVEGRSLVPLHYYNLTKYV